MRRPLVAGNWKMNGTLSSVAKLSDGLCTQLIPSSVDVVVIPGFLHVSQVVSRLKEINVSVGAQTCSIAQDCGAMTGEISSVQLADIGCRWVLVGHSERRALLGETEDSIKKKYRSIEISGLGAIVCVGESLEEHRSGLGIEVVLKQVEHLLDVYEESDNLVIAYEPVWAIGTGLSATPEWAQKVHKAIRGKLSEQSAQLAEQTRILYGGSVRANNAAALFAMEDIDGGLVGGASLCADEFSAICRAAGH